MGMGAQSLGISLSAVWATVKVGWLRTLAFLDKKWADFLHRFAERVRGITGLGALSISIGGAAIDAGSAYYEMKLAADEAKVSADALAVSADNAANAALRPLASIAALKSQTNNQQAIDLLTKEDAIYQRMNGHVQKVATATKSVGTAAVATGAKLKKAATSATDAFDTLAQSMGDAIGNGFMDMVSGTKTVAESFRSMAADIVRELYKVLVVQRMVASIKQIIGGFGGINVGGKLFSGSSFAGGGFTGNGPRAGGLDGQGGFLAMMHPRETVIDHTKGQSGGTNFTINQTFTGGVTRADLGNAVPQIVEASKSAVLDAMRRHQGGFA